MALPDLTRKLTYEDYVLIPEDGQRHEILDGEHYVTPAPLPRHQIIVGRLHLRLGNYVEERDPGLLLLAPTDVLLSAHDVVQPDLLFISKSRLEILTRKNIQGAPDLVIEVLSESTRHRDERLKLARYERLGVGEYWMFGLDPKTARVFRRDGGRLRLAAGLSAEDGDVLTSPLFPGLTIPLAAIFA
ncbi:MAG: Uma2 family endonuclease [Thermoanaerobaculia bacterium]